MANYMPFNYETINVAAGSYNPSTVKSFNNKTFAFWERSLFQRACSTLIFELPDEWQGSVRDFLYYCLFKFGYVGVADTKKYGLIFQPGNLSGMNLYYQPTTFIFTNPNFEGDSELEIGKDCEILKLTPDYRGLWDIISYYSEKLSTLDNAINMSLINNKFAFLLGARNKTGGEALKKMLDKVNRGEPAVVLDLKLLNDPQDKAEPFQMVDIGMGRKETYLTTDQLMDFQTILNAFDTEIGIPTIPYQKKERLVTSEAESKVVDATSRSIIWHDTLKSSMKVINDHFGISLDVKLRYDLADAPAETPDEEEEEING